MSLLPGSPLDSSSLAEVAAIGLAISAPAVPRFLQRFEDSTRAPLRLAFPAMLASRWVPGLFSDRPA